MNKIIIICLFLFGFGGCLTVNHRIFMGPGSYIVIPGDGDVEPEPKEQTKDPRDESVERT